MSNPTEGADTSVHNGEIETGSGEIERQIIVYGDPGDGFHYVGPFDTVEEAIEYAEHDGERNRDWWISDIAGPAGEEDDEEDDGLGAHITITAELAIAVGEIAKRHPECGIRIEFREGDPEQIWHVGAIDGEPSDTWYVVNDTEVSDVTATVACKFCGNQVAADTAHMHQGEYVGEDCCWDERLRVTE